MTITLYNITDDAKMYPKTLLSGTVKTGALRSDKVDILNPVIDVQGNIFANYCYIQEFNRYYYVTTQHEITGITTLQCKVDALQSFLSEVENAPMIAARASKNDKFNSYIADNQRQMYQYTTQQFISIGDVGLPDTAIMVTVG